MKSTVSNEDSSDEYSPEIKPKTKKIKKRFDDFVEGEILKECNVKKGVYAKVKKSGDDDTKNPQPFFLKLTPLVANLIRTQVNERMIDTFEATVDLTSSYLDALNDKLSENYKMISRASIPLSKYSTANRVNIRIPKTEVFDCKSYQKEKFKVMVTASVSKWLHIYKDAFNIELSDVFSALVLTTIINYDGIDANTIRNCSADLDIFYEHINEKVYNMSGVPEPLKDVIEPYLMMLAAIGVKQRTCYFGEWKVVLTNNNGHGTRGHCPFKSKPDAK
jgi:hypothetical protein